MNKSGNDQTKEHTEIRRKINRVRRRTNRKILDSKKENAEILNFKNTSGWITW